MHCTLLIGLLFSSQVFAFGQVIPFTSARWDLGSGEIVSYQGKESLFLKNEVAYIRDSEFVNGIIEFDINFAAERGFMGAVWRMQDKTDFEEFYMRPHQSGNPDANQYTPVFHGLASWQLYHGPGYGVPVQYDFDEWMHIKIIVNNSQGEVYIRDMEKPVLFISEMKQAIKSGFVGIRVGNFAPAYFADFSFKEVEDLPLLGKAETSGAGPTGIVRTWAISPPFPEGNLSDSYELSPAHKEGINWEALVSESTGITNLARLHGMEVKQNTVFARFRFFANEEGLKPLRLGYSDRVRVYANDRLLYTGNNTYRSRDYRYLGTIGLFDEVYIPVQSGWNEVWIAVSESFGGWGIMAQMPNQEGIRFGKVINE